MNGGLNEYTTPQLLIPQLHTGSIASPIKVGNGRMRECVLSRPLASKSTSKLLWVVFWCNKDSWINLKQYQKH